MEIYHKIAHQLLAAYPDREAHALARLVLEERYNLSQTDLLLDKDSKLSADDRRDLANIVDRLLANEPVQYVLGQAWFCSRPFHVEPGVLIPRPETEELVRMIVQKNAHRNSGLSVLDIGTGSGCIAISLALDLPKADVTAWDISSEALKIATDNAQTLKADIHFQQQDILHPEPTDRQWDVIVSNPPYVRQLEAAEMSANVLKHEPHLALFVSDDDPLIFYREIGQFAWNHLAAGGRLYFEINQYLGKETADMIENIGFSDVKVHQDAYNNNRMLSCSKK